MDADVVVVGAGLAGLQCARRLASRGTSVVLVESQEAVGGRQRTDLVDGFRLDRGFQVINPAYPALRRWVDLKALDLRPFGAGVVVRRDASSAVLTHPVWHPSGIPATLRSGLIRPREIAALIRWAGPVVVAPRRVMAGRDVTRREGMDRAGLQGPLRAEVLEPFLAGVLAEDTGETSDIFTRLLVRMFAVGRPALPAEGVQRLPEWLAQRCLNRRVPVNIRTGSHVDQVLDTETGVQVTLDSGERIASRRCVVAVGPQQAERVDPGFGRAATHGLQTFWFAADQAPTSSTMLAVDGRRRGPVLNAAVMSNVLPTYAPRGRHLIQASCLLDPAGTPVSERDVRRQTGEMLCPADPGLAAGWDLIRRDEIPHALPVQASPLQTRRPAQVGRHLYLAGDHRDTASIQGAMVSGTRVAAAVLRSLNLDHRDQASPSEAP